MIRNEGDTSTPESFPLHSILLHVLTPLIVCTCLQGSIIPVVVDITANHQGHFTFKLCPNNDIWQDPKQDCFDRWSERFDRRVSELLMFQICSEDWEGCGGEILHQGGIEI